MAKRRIKHVPIKTLTPYAKNPREHTADQVDAIARSIEQFGWAQPILVDAESVIVAGHGRYLAAKQLGHVQVPVIVMDDLTPEQARAYRIADNRLSDQSDWKKADLVDELNALIGEDIDVTTTGFSHIEIERITFPGDPKEGDDEDVRTRPKTKPVTKPGDVWLCGPHRIGCGDARDPAFVDQVLGGKRPFIMVTDPPYGVDYDPVWRDEPFGIGDRSQQEIEGDLQSDWREAYALFPGDVAYVWMAANIPPHAALDACGYDVRAMIVWAKPMPIVSRGNYNWQTESCFYAAARNFAEPGGVRWLAGGNVSNLWEIDVVRSTDSQGHSTQKPVECMARPLRHHSGDVYDPFIGSGTTLIAAEQEGRVCYGLDVDPGWIDVTVIRWEAETGGKAERA